MSCCPNRTFLPLIQDTCSGNTRTLQPGESIQISFLTVITEGATDLIAATQMVYSDGHAIQLPPAQAGLIIFVKNTHATTTVIVTAATGLVEKSGAGVFISGNDGMCFGSDGTDWWILSERT